MALCGLQSCSGIFGDLSGSEKVRSLFIMFQYTEKSLKEVRSTYTLP